MKQNLELIFILCLALLICGCSQSETTVITETTAAKIELKDNWYYLNGEKFFIKAIGYEIAARPGQHPYEDERQDYLELMKFDLENIKKGGYNTIRTWSQYSEAQLKLVQESGLKLIMGLEVNPEEDYGDPKFINHCKTQLEDILKYAPKYDCIISYLVINEPQTDHIHSVSAKAFKNLMQMMVNMIHEDHPGIPVTLAANAMISDWMDQTMFDVYAYNCYGYNEGQTATMGFRDYIKGLNELNGLDKPFIITEFGHSVSPKGGFGSFGSRTLKEQSEGLVSNYRDLMDTGAVGMCPFYYADGWWKGGEKSIHNKDQPEEWFGFWGYKDVNDKYGSPRPVWFAMRDYMKGLIISPKNKTIHTNTTTIPLEFYNDATIKKVVVKNRDEIIYSKNITNAGYFADQLTINPVGMEAMELAFEFFDSEDNSVKNESIIILACKTAIELPKLTIEVTPEKDLNESKNASIKTKIETNENFKLISDLIVSYNTHLGWDVGQQISISITEQLDKKIITSESSFFIPDNSWVINASAGIYVRHGKFTFKIHDQKIIYRGDWAKEISR